MLEILNSTYGDCEFSAVANQYLLYKNANYWVFNDPITIALVVCCKQEEVNAPGSRMYINYIPDVAIHYTNYREYDGIMYHEVNMERYIHAEIGEILTTSLSLEEKLALIEATHKLTIEDISRSRAAEIASLPPVADEFRAFSAHLKKYEAVLDAIDGKCRWQTTPTVDNTDSNERVFFSITLGMRPSTARKHLRRSIFDRFECGMRAIQVLMQLADVADDAACFIPRSHTGDIIVRVELGVRGGPDVVDDLSVLADNRLEFGNAGITTRQLITLRYDCINELINQTLRGRGRHGSWGSRSCGMWM